MKKSFVIFICILTHGILLSNQDSLVNGKLRSFRGFYATAYYGIQQKPNFYFSKYLDESIYDYDIRNFAFKIPNIGIGYVLSHKAFFIRTDLSYTYGYKNIDEFYTGNSTKIDGPAGFYEINSFSIYNSFGSYKGKTYYKFEDHIKGKLNLHYFDLGTVLGGNILPCFRLYTGWRFSYLVKANYNAIQNRKAETYIITGYTSQNSVKDSFIESTQLELRNKEVGLISNQVLESKIYTTLGFCFNFKIKEKVFLLEGQYDFNRIFLFRVGDFNQDYAVLKLAYVFNYTTYFGNKKSKD